MRILHTVEFYWPSVGGAQEVVRQISERLAQRGHDVTVATSHLPQRAADRHNGVAIRSFRISGNAVRGMAGEIDEYQRFLSDGQFDVMMSYAAQQWTADASFPILDRLHYRKILAPCGFSGLHWTEYAGYFQGLPDILRRYDALIVHSDEYRDTGFLKSHSLTNWVRIPNGAGEEFEASKVQFRDKWRIPADMPLLLTVGSHTGAKGHSTTIEAFVRARIGRACLVIIGNTLDQGGCRRRCSRFANLAWFRTLGQKRVVLLDPPREEVVAAYREADLFVFPSNIECSPLVLFECCASGLPFITHAVGNAQEIGRWTQAGAVLPCKTRSDGWVMGSASAFATEIERLMRAPEERRVLRQNGLAAWKRSFHWERIVDQYERVYRGNR